MKKIKNIINGKKYLFLNQNKYIYKNNNYQI